MVIAYKAFGPDLKCTAGGNTFQYIEGIWNEEPEANCYENGFHCAADPLDCLHYYPSWDDAVYYMVLAGGDIHEDGSDSKISCTRMKLVRKLSKIEFIYHAMNYMLEHPYTSQGSGAEGIYPYTFASNGMSIVRGKNPYVVGRQGEIVGFVKEKLESHEVQSMTLCVIPPSRHNKKITFEMVAQEGGDDS